MIEVKFGKLVIFNMMKECQQILTKRLKQIKQKQNDVLINAYQIVIDDLIDNTDSCTGELEF